MVGITVVGRSVVAATAVVTAATVVTTVAAEETTLHVPAGTEIEK